MLKEIRWNERETAFFGLKHVMKQLTEDIKCIFMFQQHGELWERPQWLVFVLGQERFPNFYEKICLCNKILF